MLIGRYHGWLVRFLFAAIVWVTIILLLLAILIRAQIRFLPYHDERWGAMPIDYDGPVD
jgi:hypothetical protein